MPYEKPSDMTDSVKNKFSTHAQEIYRAASNSVEEQCGEESRAHRVAWGAVERKYEKNDNGEWKERS